MAQIECWLGFLKDGAVIWFDRRRSIFILIKYLFYKMIFISVIYEPVHEISNNEVCATSKTSDQPAHTHSLIRAFASRLSIL